MIGPTTQPASPSHVRLLIELIDFDWADTTTGQVLRCRIELGRIAGKASGSVIQVT
jgi:hypothetical protein